MRCMMIDCNQCCKISQVNITKKNCCTSKNLHLLSLSHLCCPPWRRWYDAKLVIRIMHGATHELYDILLILYENLLILYDNLLMIL